MAVRKSTFLLLLLILKLQDVASVRETFRAAVYEHVVVSPDDAEKIVNRSEAVEHMMKNLEVFQTQSKLAAEKGAKILVFPEYGITGFGQSRDSMVPYLEDIPDPKTNWNPCDNPARHNKSDVQRMLSCMARDNNIYIVANMGDTKTCDVNSDKSCPSDGRYQFNTNVIFDNKGKLISRYHKRHLWDESPLFDPSHEPEYATIDTPFGKFGTIVCFDMLFYYPTGALSDEYDVHNILVTSAWDVNYPFIIPLQMYAGLSEVSRSNVIVANIRSKDERMAGSGLFSVDRKETSSEPNFNSSRGELVCADMPVISKAKLNNTNTIIASNASTKQNTKPFNGHYVYGIPATFVILPPDQTSAYVCHRPVCCSLRYNFHQHDPEELFVLGASDYAMTTPGKLHLQLCAVHRCASKNHSTCGDPVTTSNSIFSYIRIQAFLQTKTSFPYVTTVTDEDGVSVEMGNYYFDSKETILESLKQNTAWLSFVIFGSVDPDLEDEDRADESSNTSSGVRWYPILLLTVIFKFGFQMTT